MNTLIQESLGDAIVDALRSLMFQLCDTVYRLISFAFRTFEALGTATILKDQDLARIFERVGLILGLFMLFRVTFAMIQYIVDPDKMTDKTKGLGNIVKKIVIAIVLLGSTSTIFKMAFKVQEVLIDNHVISNLIFGPNAVDLTDDNYYGGAESSNFGGHLSAELFSAFYRPNEKIDTSSNEFNNATKLQACYTWLSMQTDNETGNVSSPMSRQIARNGGALTGYDSYAAYCLEEKGMINKDLIDTDSEESKSSVKEYGYIAEFDGSGFIALAVGAFALYTIIVFTIQVGIRVIQLAYLQIIAPIPIMMYITPKGDEQLKKWVSQCTTTFLDFFLRTAIIYFAVFAIQSLWSSDTIANILTAGNISQSGWQKAYVMVVMVLAILLFAKKVPNLLKEIFPSLGGAAGFDYGLSFKKTFVEPLKSAYNSPLGWGLKLGKAGAVAGIGAIDRKIHNLPKPRNKFQQKLDKLMPGRAEYIKNRNQALVDEKLRLEELELGEKLNKEYTKDSIVNKFNSSEYKDSYSALGKAKEAEKLAKGALDDEQRKATDAIQRYGADSNEYKVAKRRVEIAEGNLKSAQGKLELAKQKHESNKKIYKDDANIEDAFKYYKDTHEEPKDIDIEIQKEFNGQRKQQENKQEDHRTPQEKATDAYNTLLETVNNGGSEEEIQQAKINYQKAEQQKKELEDDLDDFFDRQDDGFGGQ